MPPFQPALISRLQHPNASPAVASSPTLEALDAGPRTHLLNVPPPTRSVSSSSTSSAAGEASGSISGFGPSIRSDGVFEQDTSTSAAPAVSDEVARSYASSTHASIDPSDTRSTALDLLRSVSKKTAQAEEMAAAQRRFLGKGKATVEAPLFPSAAIEQQATLADDAGSAILTQPSEVQDDQPKSITPHDALEVRVERSYYVMTAAGKPVYVSPPLVSPPWPVEAPDTSIPDATSANKPDAGLSEEDGSSEKTMTRVGVLAALSAIYAAGGDRLRSLSVDGGAITFLSRGQLLMVCVTRLAHSSKHPSPSETVCYPDPEVVTRARLEALHVQIQALLSPAALGALFKRSASADPGRLLGGSGTSRILASALLQAHEDRALLTGAIQPARLPLRLRDQLGALLRPSDSSGADPSTACPARPKDLLYAMLLHHRRILQIARPKRHSAHPTDIAALLNTIFSISRPGELEAEHFIPLSLPKFAPQGFVYVYSATIDLTSPRPGTPRHHRTHRSLSSVGSSHSLQVHGPTTSRPSTPVHPASPSSSPASSANTHPHLTLCFVSADREALPLLQQWRAEIEHTIRHPSLHARLVAALPRTSYSVTQVPVPGLRHFMYKSRVNAQATAPTWCAGQAYRPNSIAATRLNRLYDQAYDALHASSHHSRPGTGEEEPVPASLAAPPLKMHCITTVHEVVLAWLTEPFELYLALPADSSKQAAVQAANATARWVKKHETALFLLSPPVF